MAWHKIRNFRNQLTVSLPINHISFPILLFGEIHSFGRHWQTKELILYLSPTLIESRIRFECLQLKNGVQVIQIDFAFFH